MIDGKMTDAEKLSYEEAENLGAEVPNILSDSEVADLLVRGADLVAWYNDLQDYALSAILDGKTIPGFKVVEGRSNRAFKDADAAMELIKAAGYEEAVLYERKAKTLSQLETMIGKKQFAEIVGSEIVKPQGKPTLVPESDKREPFNPAAADFAGVGNNGQLDNECQIQRRKRSNDYKSAGVSGRSNTYQYPQTNQSRRNQ